LTNHGVLQAQQLGAFLKETRPPVNTIFSSTLQRARRTAEAIITAQEDGSTEKHIRFTQSDLIKEKDFGIYEGKKYADVPKDVQDQHVETAASLNERCDIFLSEYLIPAIKSKMSRDDNSLIVVAHGTLLSYLWRRLILRLSRKSITLTDEVQTAFGQVVLESLGSWGNTAFLELELTLRKGDSVVKADVNAIPDNNRDEIDDTAKKDAPDVPAEDDVNKAESTPVDENSNVKQDLADVCVLIRNINCQDHLRGVKRARGGIGSAAYDDRQQSLDGFFPRSPKRNK